MAPEPAVSASPPQSELNGRVKMRTPVRRRPFAQTASPSCPRHVAAAAASRRRRWPRWLLRHGELPRQGRRHRWNDGRAVAAADATARWTVVNGAGARRRCRAGVHAARGCRQLLTRPRLAQNEDELSDEPLWEESEEEERLRLANIARMKQQQARFSRPVRADRAGPSAVWSERTGADPCWCCPGGGCG